MKLLTRPFKVFCPVYASKKQFTDQKCMGDANCASGLCRADPTYYCRVGCQQHSDCEYNFIPWYCANGRCMTKVSYDKASTPVFNSSHFPYACKFLNFVGYACW